MKNSKKILMTFFCILVILITITANNFVYADVGSFESYGGGHDFGGSSSWSSSSHDYSSGSSNGIFIFGGDGLSLLIWIFIIIIYIIIKSRLGDTNRKNQVNYSNYNTQNLNQLEAKQIEIENKIQINDPNFNKEEFISFSKNLFVKLQQAWTDRDWETIRVFETESLFEQHRNQLQGYISNNQINVMDRICVNYAHLYEYAIEGDKEILTVRLNSRMADYIIDATTRQVLRGDKQTERVNTYLLTFIRKNGVKTKEGTIDINTTNCPNCGAPTKITSSGKCEYCGSVVITGEYSWALSNLEREI